MPITTDGLKWVNQSLFGTWGKPSHLTVTDGITMAHSKFTVVEISASGTTAKLRAEFGPHLGNFAWNKWSVTNGQASGLIKLNEVIQNNGIKLQGQTWTLTVELKFNTVVRRIFEGFLPYTVSHTLRGSTEYSSLEGVTYQNLLNYNKLNKSYYNFNNNVVTNPTGSDNTPWNEVPSISELMSANKVYTLIIKALTPNTRVQFDNKISFSPINVGLDIVGETKMLKVTSPSDATGFYFKTYCTVAPSTEVKVQVMAIEGDYTNKPTPSYFEGIKSVSEEEANKLGIKSTKTNFVESFTSRTTLNTGEHTDYKKINIPLIGELYQGLYVDNRFIGATSAVVKFYNHNKQQIEWLTLNGNPRKFDWKNIIEHAVYYRITHNELTPITFDDFFMGKSVEYSKGIVDKKEIQLTEPLRGFPTGAKDKIQQRDDGVYLTKRVQKNVYTGLDSDGWRIGSEVVGATCHDFRLTLTPYAILNSPNQISNQFVYRSGSSWIGNTEGFVIWNHSPTSYELIVSISKTRCNDLTGFKNLLKANLLEVYYELATPVETKLPVGTNINLETYEEVTNFFGENKVTPLYSTVALVSN